jgi:hypothetical protein
MYLLKRAGSLAMGNDFSRFESLLPALGGRSFEQARQCSLGIFRYDQTFLFGSALLRLFQLLGHTSHAIKKSAPAGVRTRTTRKSPACKAGVFASYTTGAKKRRM